LTEFEVDATPGVDEKMLRLDGGSVDVEVHGIRLYEDQSMVMTLVLDTSDRKKHEEYIRFLAYHDSLTSLGNRALLTETLERETQRLKREPGSLAVLFLDLDRLKLINDTLGHSAGDWVIRQVARRIQSVTPERATLCRQGGDEFIIILPEPDGEESTTLANVILQVLQQPIEYRGDEYFVSASIGIALYPENGVDGETLLKNADAALYRSKDRGGNVYTMASRLPRQKSESDLSLGARMHRALENSEFILYYQPIIDRQRRLLKWEALIRWPQSDGSFISPDRFIPLAEETGLIRHIDEWVLEQATREIQTFPGEPAGISVNLSPREFESPGFPDKMFGILKRTGLAPERLVLESTERTLIDDLDKTGRILSRLDEGGIHISLDDFGVGYTSLGYLKRLPIASLKMDRSLLVGVPDRSDATLIVAAIVGLGRNLGIEVVAEGVETRTQLEYLNGIECDALQGYFISRPIPPSEVPAFLETL
jgi:diguanylate cyclase (GGDEF)-like protein